MVNYYDKEYFTPGKKSSYALPYTWENEKNERLIMAYNLKKILNPLKVLDVGCAKGFLVKAFLKNGVDAYGCDISNWAVENCEPETKGKLLVCDIKKGLPYGDNSFDLITCLGTLEHIEIPYLNYVIEELSRVTSKWVYISVPISLNMENRPCGDPSHVTYINPSFWIDLFIVNRLIIDLRRSKHTSSMDCHNVELAFAKEELPFD